MLKSFKTEINPTAEQAATINRTIGTCRYIYNMYVAYNKMHHQNNGPFMTGKDFSKWLNNIYLPSHPEMSWIKDVSSKAVKQSLEDGNRAFQRFFQKKAGFPRFKKKGRSDPKMYFVKNNPADCLCERHRLKIPTLGWVRLKEKGYIPMSKQGYIIRSGTVSQKADRYYVSVLIDMPDAGKTQPTGPGLGIDVGIKELAVCSDGTYVHNINKTAKIKKTEKALRQAQRCLSRKYENKKKGGATQGKNIAKQRLKVQRLHQRLDNMRTDYVNKAVDRIVKTKPSYIALEDLNVSSMMRNSHLAKAVASQKLYEFRQKLITKCRQEGIEARLVDRWYPSSKLCHSCGMLKAGLRLSDRTYSCGCGWTADRDYNASLNLRDAEVYKIA